MGFVINLKADTGLVDRSENTTRFYKDIKRFQPFTREEEVKWFTILKEGTPSERKHAREYIINCNQRLVIAAAKNYANTNNLTDYINEANFGLIKAVDKLMTDIELPKSIKEFGIDEKEFYKNLDTLVELAFDDQCTGANPAYPLMSEIKQLYIDAYNGVV